MLASEDDFLPTVIGVLDRLHDKTAERGNSMLSFLLGLARTEAEDEMRSAIAHTDRRAVLRDTSCENSWRPTAAPESWRVAAPPAEIRKQEPSEVNAAPRKTAVRKKRARA